MNVETDTKQKQAPHDDMQAIVDFAIGMAQEHGLKHSVAALRKRAYRVRASLTETTNYMDQVVQIQVAWEEAKKTLPPDPNLNAPWSQAIAIMDEACDINMDIEKQRLYGDIECVASNEEMSYREIYIAWRIGFQAYKQTCELEKEVLCISPEERA